MWKYFIDAVFSRNYFNFTGRSTRKAFWCFMAVYILLSILVSLLQKVAAAAQNPWADFLAGWVSLGWSVLILIPLLAITVRRFRDAGVSPWWLPALIGVQLGCSAWILSAAAPWEVYAAMAVSLATGAVWFWTLCRPSAQ